jgi:hypothetical protein
MPETLKREQVVSMISALEMLGFLKTNGTNCRFVAITTRTPVVKIKADNPWGAGKSETGLYKVSRKIGLINVNYNAAVERRIAARLGVKPSEVEYEAGNTWYQHLTTADGKALPVVVHKDEAKRGEFYLQYYPQTDKSVNQYVNEAGELVNAGEVKPWLYKESIRSEYKPTVIAVKLSNIHRLKASGIVIEMPELPEVEAILAD